MTRLQKKLGPLVAILLLGFLGCASARADAALLLEEPFGEFGAMNPTGHAAVYLDRVCADTPTHLRLCRAGENGVVISRYHRIDGYDWLAIPLLPYLYAVDEPDEIPESVTPRLELKLRDTYRRDHLASLVPDDPRTEIPRGEWIQLIGAAYDRRIWGYEVATTEKQDEALIRRFNHRRNINRYNVFFRNCANFTGTVLNFYYPHSIRRNFIADAGTLTPKQAARSLVGYSRRHPGDDLRTFVIPQVPGTLPRSTAVDGVVEGLVKSKKYVVPLAILHPFFAGGLVVAYLGDGRFHPDRDAEVFDPRVDWEPLDPARVASVSHGSSAAPAMGSRQGSGVAVEPAGAEPIQP